MKKQYLFAATSILLWSTMPTVSKILLGKLDSFQILCISALFASLFLLIVNIVTGNIKRLKAYRVKDWIITVLIGLPGMFLYYVFLYTGTSLMPASQAFIVNYLWPIMSVVFACIILKEKMTVRKLIAIGISFLGVVVVTGADLAHFNVNSLLGAGCCALGAVSYGIFTALNQKFGYEKRISMMIMLFTSFVLTSIINIGKPMELSLFETLGMAWNGVFSIGIATTSWQIALESRNTAKISNLAYVTPFLSLIWTSVFLKEEITVFSVVGLAIIVLGIFVQLKDKKSV